MYGGLVPNFPVAEAWHALFDIYQDVDVPDGVYALSLNGFCRLEGGETEVPAEIYMNDGATKLMNIKDDPIPLEQAKDGFNCYLSNGDNGAWTTNPIFLGAHRDSPNDAIDNQDEYGCYPNGMGGASVAFSADRYKATVYGIIKGGKMRVGVRNLKSGTSWVLWSNFKLYYIGKDANALRKIFDEKLKIANSLLNEKFNGTLKTQLKEALNIANNATDAETLFDTLADIERIMTEANESIKSYEALSELINSLNSAILNLKNVADEKAVSLAYELLGKMKSAYNDETATEESILSYYDKVAEAIAKLKTPVDDPTGKEPLDFTSWIVNPNFDVSADGWSLSSENAQNKQWQRGYYYGESKIQSFAELWRPAGSGLGKSSIRQIIKYLPRGKYKLEADVIACNQSNASNPCNGTYLFAFEGENIENSDVTDTTPVSTGNEAPKHFELTFKKMADNSILTLGVMATKTTNANWLAVDNFKLTYYGYSGIEPPKPTEFVVDGINYTIVSDTEVEVSTLDDGSYSGKVIIPSEVVFDNVIYTVIGIGNMAFKGSVRFTDVTMPNTIQYISRNAFYGCNCGA